MTPKAQGELPAISAPRPEDAGPEPCTVVPDAGQHAKVDKSNTQLLAWLDTQFGPMLEGARAPSTVNGEKADADPAPASDAERRREAVEAQRARDQAALVVYLGEQLQGPVEPPKSAVAPGKPPERFKTKSGRVMAKPRTGLGPSVYIGFDAEWTKSRRGHNRIDSVQFVLIGPTGKSHEKLFDLSGYHDIDQRIRVTDALDVVLDEAEQAGVFDEWPHEVVLVGFFLRGDLKAFADFPELCKQLDGVGGTLGTVSRPAKVMLPMDGERQARLKSRHRAVTGTDFDPRELKVRILDASKLTPPGSSLEKVGKWLQQPKVKLPQGYTKSDMRKLKRERPKDFRDYALHDAWLAVMFALWVLWFADRYLGLKGLSATVSGLSVRLAELCMREDGVHPDVALNYTKARSVSWDRLRQRPVTQTKRVPIDIRRWLQAFLVDSYSGGRNEAYIYGPSEVREWYDSDLTAAYLTGLVVVQALDYDNVVWTQDIQAFIGPVAGYAQVRFQFPATTSYPCLPVGLDTGLCFPLSGVSMCTSPEIELALEMGASLEVIVGLVIPFKPREQVFSESAPLLKRWRDDKAKRQAKEAAAPLQPPKLKVEGDPGDEDVMVPQAKMEFPPESHGDAGYRSMESFAIVVLHKRSMFKRKSLPFEFCKLVGNGLYGKTGQGFKGNGAFSPKEMGTVVIGQSRVSEPAIAALLCGFVRATVSEILWKLPADAKVVSLTTDGALMSVPTAQLDLTGTMCRRYQALVDRVSPGTLMVEEKHSVRQVFVPRTRGCFTIERVGDRPAMCAKAGHKVVIPDDASDEERERLRTPEAESDWMIRLTLERRPGQRLPQESFFSLRDQLVNDWDLQMQMREVAVALEPDFKRRPVNPRMVRMEPYDAEHLAFDTVPWDRVEDALMVREVFGRWKREHNLKTMEDWHSWQAALVTHLGNRRRRLWQDQPAPLTATKTGPVKALRGGTGQKHLCGGDAGLLRLVMRTFLAVFTQGLWGLAGEKDSWTYKSMAQWLTEQGYPVSVSDVKNARRTRVDEGIAAETPEVRKFLDAMRERFPGLEVQRFLTVF